ncbi:MAG: hypothetical protein R2759_08275 [Bacteroidales bacterium]
MIRRKRTPSETGSHRRERNDTEVSTVIGAIGQEAYYDFLSAEDSSKN